MITIKQIERAVIKLAERYDGCKELTLVGVMDGALMFLRDLMGALTADLIVCTTKVSTYEGTKRVKEPKILVPVPEQYIRGKDVLIVEDIIDSGSTIDCVLEYIKSMKPRGVSVLSIFDNVGKATFNLFGATDEFVVGYGMDHIGRYREYPCIMTLKEAEG